MHYDLLVIGGEPAAHHGAVAAARLNKRVAVVERPRTAKEGVAAPASSVQSQALREVLLQHCHRRVRRASVENCTSSISMDDVRRRLLQSVERETAVALAEFERRGIDVHSGTAGFSDDHTIFVSGANGTRCLEADRFLIATGTRPAPSRQLPFDGWRVFDTDNVLQIEQTPRSMIVIGAGALGVAHAMLFAALGTQVTLVGGRDDVDAVPQIDRSLNIESRLGAEAVGIDDLDEEQVAVSLKDGARLIAETVLFAAGRVGNTGDLNLEAAGLRPDERGRLWCNDNLQTWVPHIYGAGDVVGFPQQRGTARGQAERAVRHAFGRSIEPGPLASNLRIDGLSVPNGHGRAFGGGDRVERADKLVEI